MFIFKNIQQNIFTKILFLKAKQTKTTKYPTREMVKYYISL